MAPPFRFGIVAPQAKSSADWKETTRRAEAAGYSSLLLPDTSGPVLSTFSAMATAEALGLSYIVVGAQAAEWFASVVRRLAGR